jgi:hypothetical protein
MTILPAKPAIGRFGWGSRLVAGAGGGVGSAALAGLGYAFTEAGCDTEAGFDGPCPLALLIPIGALLGTALGTWLSLRLTRNRRAGATASLAVLLLPLALVLGRLAPGTRSWRCGLRRL